ncbi:MAG: signal peptidase I [Salinivirgaceae bacterium]|jgi:signal peptidase I|nr:signal peptidase I [Salinivirgaceae bacterium]
MNNFWKNKWTKFGIYGTLYLLWVIWNTNYWWILGLPVVFDIYVTKKVHWAFWKKRGAVKQTKVVEWVDAIIFAVIAASFIRTFFFEAYTIPTSSMEKSLLVGDYLFVSKSAYGPRKPITPLSFPFVHHSLPMTNNTKQSFIESWQRDYFRMQGYRTIKNNDVVVFNFPEGDTVCLENQAPSYYQLCRDARGGREEIWRRYTVAHRPVDKCENYIKRCIAIPGDSLKIVDGQVYVNGKPQEKAGKVQHIYHIITDGTSINPRALQKLGVALDDIRMVQSGYYQIPLTKKVADRIRTFNIVKRVERKNAGDSDNSGRVFPHDSRFKWNQDNYGSIWIPKKGATTDLTLENLPFYKRVIGHYEGNDLEVKDSIIYINGEVATSYTFKMDYYWMMGDNRHNSLDSRYWGYVPENHIVGRASLIWLSLDKDLSFPKNIRFKRMFRSIH